MYVPRKRDFNVRVTDGRGTVVFKGKACEITEKTLSTRVGIGDVRERIKCKSVDVSVKEDGDGQRRE